MLQQLFKSKKTSILHEWFKTTNNQYPSKTAQFMQNEKDQFANPVGHIYQNELKHILEGIINQKDISSLSSNLENIIKIKAIQEFPPAESLSFLFSLKNILITEIINQQIEQKELLCWEVEKQIDELIKLSFDIYTKCREKIFEIRLNHPIRKNLKHRSKVKGDFS